MAESRARREAQTEAIVRVAESIEAVAENLSVMLETQAEAWAAMKELLGFYVVEKAKAEKRSRETSRLRRKLGLDVQEKAKAEKRSKRGKR